MRKAQKNSKLSMQNIQYERFRVDVPVMPRNHDENPYELYLLQQDWSITLQLQLLDSLSIFGHENWHMAAKYLNSQFTPQELRDHYDEYYGDHMSDDPNKLPKQFLIQDQQTDLYVKASKQKQHKKRQIERQKQRKKIQLQQQGNQPEQSFIKKRLPQQFGYQQHKKIFFQPLNEQAQTMILGLQINESDPQQIRNNKIAVLKQYDKLVKQRQIIEKDVMMNNLMECKYSINFNTLNNLNDDVGQSIVGDASSNSRRGNSSKKSASKSKSQNKKARMSRKKKKQDLFFGLKRIHNQQLGYLHLIYMKMSKFDHNNSMKDLFKQQEKIAEKQKELKQLLAKSV